MEGVRAFRLYGSFSWPPVGDLSHTEERLGAVEVWYFKKGENDHVACVRWLPKKELGNTDGSEWATSLSDVPPLPPVELKLGEAFPSDTPWAYRLDSDGPVALQFKGGFLLDQYSAEKFDGNLESKLDRRFVLKREYLLDGTDASARFSELIIDSRELAFNIALPMPIPQTNWQQSKDLLGSNPYYLPLTASFPLTLPSLWNGLPVPMTSMSIGNGLPIPMTSMSIGNAEKPFAKALGGFGLAKDTNNTDFVAFTDHASWPNASEIFAHALKKGGYNLTGLTLYLGRPPVERLTIGTNNEKSLSIRFKESVKESDGPGVTYTYRIGATCTQDVDFGDVRCIGEKFQLRFPPVTDGWLDTESELLYVDLECRITVADEDIWTLGDLQSDFKLGEVVIRIGFDDVTIAAPADPNPKLGVAPSNPPEAVGVGTLLHQTFQAMRLANLDLQHLTPPQPQSILPAFTIKDEQTVQCALFTTVPLHLNRDGKLLWQNERQENYRLSLADDEQYPKTGNKTIALEARLEAFSAIAAPFGVALGHDDAALNPEASEHPIMFRIQQSEKSGGDASTATLGGLQFHYPLLRALAPSGDGENKQDYSHLRLGSRAPIVIGDQSFYAGNVDLRLRLNVHVEPVAIDVPWGDRKARSQPLLIRESSGRDGLEEQGFILDARESLSAFTDRHLTAALYDKDQGESGGRAFILLGNEPFSIFKVYSKPLAARGDERSASVAAYDSDTREWEFAAAATPYHYVLPPQAVGESMDKPGRLEIQDLDGTETEDEARRPYKAGDNPKVERRVVEFRLPPSTECWVNPSDVTRGSSLPEHATDRIFSQRVELGLGAALVALRGEFTYGLTVAVMPAKELGIYRRSRVAEIEALIGRPVGRPRASNPDPDITRRWSALSHAIARRPERLEVWADDPDSDIAFAPAQFRSSARFALRTTALHRSPVAALEANNPPPEESTLPRPRTHPNGLSGGALWPIESKNIFELLQQAPNSTGGELSNVALSPLGGDADQKAEFLNGRIKIISETRGGYLQRIQVEVLGRICTYWHRAKHVVVYERTVNPSAQFTPENGLGTRTRRPVLRKVSEYCEILEQERPCLDSTGADPKSCGFLKSVRFNSRIINVDSLWSRDVGNVGYVIPIWNRHAACIRPLVYPRPDVAFITASEGAEDNPVAAQECLNPDNLFFFADITAQTSDTNLWPARHGLDYVNHPAPSHASHSKSRGEGSANRRMEANDQRGVVSRTPRGFSRFTWWLASPAHKTKINEGWGSKPIYAALASITCMRPNPEAQSVPEQGGLSNEEEAARSLLTESYNQLKDLFDGRANPDSSKVKNTLQQIRDVLPKIPSFANPCEAVQTDLITSIKRKKLLVLETVRAWEQDISVPDTNTTKAKLAEKIIAELSEKIGPLFNQAVPDLGNLNNGIEKTRGIIKGIRADLELELVRAQRDIDALNAAYDRSKPWSKERLDDFQSKLNAIPSKYIANLSSLLEETRVRFATEVDEFAQKASSAAQLVFESLEIEAFEHKSEALASNLDEKLGDLEGKLVGVETKLGTLQEKIPSLDISDDLKKTLKDLVDVTSKATKKSRELVQTARTLRNTYSDAFTQALLAARDAVASAHGEVEALFAQIKELLNNELTNIDEALRQEITTLNVEIEAFNKTLTETALNYIKVGGHWLDLLVEDVRMWLQDNIDDAIDMTEKAYMAADAVATTLSGLASSITQVLTPENIVENIFKPSVIVPAVEKVLEPFPDPIIDEVAVKAALSDISLIIELGMDNLTDTAINTVKAHLDTVCSKLTNFIDSSELRQRIEAIIDLPGDITGNIEDIKELVESIARTRIEAEAYAERVFEAAGSITDGGLAAVPNNILRLQAAVVETPDFANLSCSLDRVGCYFDLAKEYIDTTPFEARFDQLSDRLKALGLSFPCSQFGNSLIPDSLENLDFGRIFKSFAGLKLERLFSGTKLPKNLKDHVRIAHDFDKKQQRAWVQVDVDLPMPGPHTLFSFGPFSLNFVNPHLMAFVRLEASKDTERVEESGDATITTDINLMVSGEMMVSLRQVAIRYDKASGLRVDFDPRNIQLNPVFQFLQNTLASIFGDLPGGLEVIKQNGVPVGVSYDLSTPPLSLMYGTSGVTNLQLSNQLQLVVYPNFVIANRFSLSKPELPFIFSIFIIGGTGYLTVDTEYCPVTNRLMVIAEAGAGGSATLGFAFAGVTGSVIITVSIALRYKSLPGSGGSGLTVALVVVIAGNVDVLGIVHAYIGVMLRLSYHANGDIDAQGSLSISIRICRFFKLKVNTRVRYQFSGGRSQLTKQTDVQTSGSDRFEKAKQLVESRGLV